MHHQQQHHLSTPVEILKQVYSNRNPSISENFIIGSS